MVQFNLLPDVKHDFIKARRTKHMVMVTAAVAAGSCLTVMVLLWGAVNGAQKQHLKKVNDDISNHTKELNKTEDLTKILTVQNQLKSLPELQKKKPVTSRLVVYMGQIIPAQVNIASLEVDYEAHTIEFSGNADNLDRINTFADTLKFTDYVIADDTSKPAQKAFTKVVMTSYAPRVATNATFTIKATYDIAIFDSAQDTKLVVPPNKITTRSQTNQPNSALFITPQESN